MEDCNSLVADCVVVSCCCQCLILQIAVFFLVRLPRQAAQKTRQYAKKLRIRYTKKRKRESSSSSRASEGELVQRSLRLIELELGGFSAMEEVDKVLGELSLEGEFVFGSFWGRGTHLTTSTCSSASCLAGTNYLCRVSSNYVID